MDTIKAAISIPVTFHGPDGSKLDFLPEYELVRKGTMDSYRELAQLCRDLHNRADAAMGPNAPAEARYWKTIESIRSIVERLTMRTSARNLSQRPHSSLGYRTPNEFAELAVGSL